MYIKEIGLEGLNWTNLAQDRDQWHDNMNTIINFRFHRRQIISALSERLEPSQDERW
jgi:hypothetical protein